LPGFRGTSLKDLNLVLSCWLRDVYHQRKHSSTAEAPLKRFTRHVELLRPAPADLENYFSEVAGSRVAKDRTVSLDNRLYEAPVQLIGRQVQLLYHDHQPERIEIQYQQKSYGFLVPLDLNVNCRVRRARDGDRIEATDSREYRGGSLPFGKKEVTG